MTSPNGSGLELERLVAVLEERRRAKDPAPLESDLFAGTRPRVEAAPRPAAEREEIEARSGEPYREAELGSLGSPDDFYAPAATETIRRAVARVLEVEAPIALSLLVRRVGAAWGLSRLTPRLGDRLEALLPGTGDDVFLWSGDVPATCERFRKGSSRKAEEIPPEEIAAAARAFGIGRVGVNVSRCMENGIRVLLERGRAEAVGDLSRWPRT